MQQEEFQYFLGVDAEHTTKLSVDHFSMKWDPYFLANTIRGITMIYPHKS